MGSTVDVENATCSNSIGSVKLAAYWQDLDFDPDNNAFYYVRVIEVPKPRWTTIDAAGVVTLTVVWLCMSGIGRR
ncbi:DUF3604 domain-containing protein [Ruegeria sp. Ofav3-42]|uniref:DUF3604 domain-containing protein n=1 Tax=Ruegeria sp. Ofav3-42 TaxID=2917759 RepID=UPI00351D103B